MSRFQEARMRVNGMFDPFLLDGYHIPLSSQPLPNPEQIKEDYERLQGESQICGSLRSVAAHLVLEQLTTRRALGPQARYALCGFKFVGQTILDTEKEIVAALDRVQNGGKVNLATLDRAELLYTDPTGLSLLQKNYSLAAQAARESISSSFTDLSTVAPWFKLGYRQGVGFYRNWVQQAQRVLPQVSASDLEIRILLGVADRIDPS